jgi:Double zinc ribbon
MPCPRCQHENPGGQKFCGACGARLAALCSACGTQNPPDHRFCGECGTALTGAGTLGQFGAPESYTPKHLAEKILTSKTALEGARFSSTRERWVLAARRRPVRMRVIVPAIIDQVGRNFNADETDGVSGRDRRGVHGPEMCPPGGMSPARYASRVGGLTAPDGSDRCSSGLVRGLTIVPALGSA